MAEALIGRQPIFNAQLGVVAYELLYRSLGSDSANVTDGDKATTRVILNAFSEIGLENLVGHAVAYINATENFLKGKFPIPFPPARIVLEVLEDVPVDKALIEALQLLGSRGFQIALDDVESFEKIAPLVAYAHIAKIDIRQTDVQALPTLVNQFKQHPVKLLAEKVETQDEFRRCKQMGFDLFQGYFFAKPNVVKKTQIDTSRLIIMRTLAKLQDPKASFRDMEEIIAQDVALGYKLLRVVNSAYYATSSPVKSIGQAVSFIGMNELRGWLTLLMLASIENKPHELTATALARAKMCELLAKRIGAGQAESYFLVGLFSVLDALMDMPMQTLVTGLPVSKEIVAALLHREGLMGSVLTAVTAYEQGNFEKALTLKLQPEALGDIYLDAIKWTSVFANSMDTMMAAG